MAHVRWLIAEKMRNFTKHSELLVFPALMLAIALLMPGCKPKGTVTIRETPTSGDIRIMADESFKPIVDNQVSIFLSLYKYAKITPEYKPEKELIADFLSDSVKVIVTSWTPTEEQNKLLLQVQTVARKTVVAYDAIALIMNRSNPDSLLSYNNVSDIFTGKITDWKQINPSSKSGKIDIIFDNIKSGNIRYFREKFDLPDTLASNFYAVNNNPEVIDYVSKSPGALGILSVNWISDREDTLAMSFVSKIKVAAITAPYLDQNLYYLPLQGSIYDKSYPFVREVNMISRESFSGLGSGFISFVAGDQGQRIILKSGLVPATMPIRIIQVKNE